METSNTAPAALKSTMRRIVADHVDNATGEVDCTALAEAAAAECDCNHHGGPLDDDTHPIWDWAVDIARAYERSLAG